jgi:folate-binding protein YgfZ
VAVVGPEAAQVAARVLGGVSADVLLALGEHGNMRTEWDAAPAIVARAADTGEPGYDLFVDRARAAALIAALAAAGAVEADAATAETIRIESGTPLFHRDMDEATIPLEANLESRAISFSKGCYVGQEVVIRVLHRGHGRVARKLVGMLVGGGDVPASGTTIRSGDREIGAVTSSTWSPALQRPIALGYVQRDFVEPGTQVTIGEASAEVTALPFVSRP